MQTTFKFAAALAVGSTHVEAQEGVRVFFYTLNFNHYIFA